MKWDIDRQRDKQREGEREREIYISMFNSLYLSTSIHKYISDIYVCIQIDIYIQVL